MERSRVKDRLLRFARLGHFDGTSQPLELVNRVYVEALELLPFWGCGGLIRCAVSK